MEARTMDQQISEVACDILGYLSRHPDAEDELEGVIEWWLLEQKVIRQSAVVRTALFELVRKGLVLERGGSSNREKRYRANKDKQGDIKRLLEQRQNQ